MLASGPYLCIAKSFAIHLDGMDPHLPDHAPPHWIALDAALSRLLSPVDIVRVRETFSTSVNRVAAVPNCLFEPVCAPYLAPLEAVPGALTAALHTVWRIQPPGTRVREGTCATLEPGTDAMTDTHYPPRRYPRHPVSIDCQVEGASGHASMRVSELSLGGCFVDTRMQFDPGQTVSIRASLPEGGIDLSGRVIYLLSGYGFGCAFDPLPDASRERLEEFLKQVT